MAKKSDYRDPRTNLFELLPDVFRSQTNEAVFEDVFNRYLSNPQLELVDGYVGEPLPEGSIDRQIQEPTACRQAFQLQPQIFARLGTENHIASYEDFLNELERTGVDSCRLPLWGNALQFNWVPPIDVDKLVNFRDYYWYCPEDPASAPQYITIENLCNKATQRVQAYQLTLDTFGEEFPIVALETSTPSISVNGNFTELFTPNFVVFVRESSNATINETYFTVVSSEYNATNDITVITVQEAITDDSIIDGLVSISELQTVYQSAANCFCGQDTGWDVSPWDDNQVGDVLWTDSFLPQISQPTEGAWIAANPGSVTGSPQVIEQFSIWYDTTTNELKQYNAGWIVVQTNFSAILELITGTHFWDLTAECVIDSNPWTDQNKWFHKNHVPNFTIAKQAQAPIIEYSFGAKLNEWTFTNFLWEYRESEFTTFAVTTDAAGDRLEPTLNELIPFKYVIDPGLFTITLSPEHGDRRADYPVGSFFRITNDGLDFANNGVYEVASVDYITTSTTPGEELATVITTTTGFSSANQSTDSITAVGSPATVITGSGGQFTPQVTANGDPFRTYNEHWLLTDQQVLPVPAPEQDPNPSAEIDPTIAPVTYNFAGSPITAFATYVTSQPVDLDLSFGVAPFIYTQEFTTQTIVPAGSVWDFDPQLADLARLGSDNVRVFVDGVQQFGTYVERDDSADGFVDAIEFVFDVPQFSIVRISVNESSVIDFGRSNIPVRTIRDDAAFLLASGSPQVPVGSPPVVQPINTSLIQYRFAEQIKTETNQYPLFDMFECNGDPLFQATPLFAYQESQDAPIDPITGRRVVIDANGAYSFQQFLLDPTTTPQPVIYAYELDGQLQTIWRKGLNDEQYVPQYVDVNLEPTTVGDPNGCWEVPDQLYFNVQHENREVVTFPEVLTHFRTILDEQSTVPGFIVPGNQSYLQDEINFGLGGRIKEFNDSYDTLLSSAFVNNVTPLGVIDFAHDQYENSLNTIKELYRSNVIDFLTNTSSDSINNLQNSVTDFVINSYETNDFFSLVYGDSNTFIQGSPEIGIKNWPATLPFVELGFKEQPYVIEDEVLGLLQLVHHDGHRSEPALTTTTRESLIQITLNTPDPRSTTGETLGVQVSQQFGSPIQPTTPPDLFSVLETVTTPRAGIYWYDIGDPTNRTLYRFGVSAVGATPPSDVPVGGLWYDTDTDTLRELQPSLLWEPLEGAGSPDLGSGVITAAWQEIDLDELLVNILLEVEQRLFDAAPELTELAFNVEDVLTTDVSCPTASTTVTDADTGEIYYEQTFGNFLRDIGVDDPYSADQFYDMTDAFTWNYSFSTPVTPPVPPAAFGGSPIAVPTGGWWLDLYQNLYGTPYPHLEPWKLQGYEQKPLWWDAEYLNDDPITYGNRRWKYIHATTTGMWENVRQGIVPVGELLPDGSVSTGAALEATRWGSVWNYFSVNIEDTAVDGYEPDDVFPPYWDNTAVGGSAVNRSVFATFGEIVLPSADYSFETGAPSWFDWTQSSQILYDNLTVGYRLQPMRFMHNTFGVDFIEVAGKQINEDTCKVYSHRDVEFYGDIVNTNEVLIIPGINQWYVNFNRFSGFDASASDFRPLWQSWEPLLSYQFGSIIDTQTFQISNRNFDINQRDYNIVLKRSPGIRTEALDALNVTVLESPSALASVDNQGEWKFQIDTTFPDTRQLTYYEVHDYPIGVDPIQNTFTVYQYPVVAVDQPNGSFTLAGDQTDAFTTSFAFDITGSTGNDGAYTATSVVFDPINNTTTVVTGAPLLSSDADGQLTASYRTHPWQTADVIELTSSRNVPAPLRANLQYYVIRVDDVTFQLAATAADARSGTPINLSSAGTGLVRAGQVFSKFVALDGQASNRQWNHFVIDTRFTRSIVPPARITGIQNIVNLVDGYAVVKSEEGWEINFERIELDPDTNQPVTWQLETERFIDQIFRIPRQRTRTPDSFVSTVDPISNVFTFTNLSPAWVTGTRIQFSTLDVLPTPLLPNQSYFLIRDSETDFRVALNATDAVLGEELDIIDGAGTEFSVFEALAPINRQPAIEINPFRNNVWIESPQGILSNVITGPSQDIRNVQLVTNQNGDQLTAEELSVFRLDRISRVYIPEPIRNPTVPLADTTPYNTLHISGLQLFFDGYECVILFNDRSVEDVLIYDPFVGLNTARFFMQFFRQDEFTQRPNVGGYFLTPDDDILRNIEASTKDLEQIYDTFQVLETTDLIKEGRRSLGYNGPGSLDYLQNIGLNPKSQFLFWRGFIQNKGSVNAIDAFTNSVLFEDAIVDEYWAYKIAEFGTNYQQEYPALNLFVEDSQRSEKRFEFLPPLGANAADTFEGVLTSNQERWFEQPDVLVDLADNNLSLYFDAEVTNVQRFSAGVASASTPTRWIVESDVTFDDVVVLQVNVVTNDLVTELVQGSQYNIVNSKTLSFNIDPALLLGPNEEFRLYTINPAKDKINPSKVIDVKEDIVVQEAIVWDPIRDHQYHIANNLIDFESTTDPASYTNALDLSKIDTEFWNAPETDQLWWDTSQRDYIPYTDKRIFDLDDRIQNWGQLADWADVRLYQWTESDIPPNEWDAVAAVEELDVSIDPQIRKTGRARLELSQRERSPIDIVEFYPSTHPGIGSPAVAIANCITVIDPDSSLAVGDRIVFTTDDELPLPFTAGTFYFITSITAPTGSPATRDIKVSLEQGGAVVDITPGPIFIDVSGNSFDTGSPQGTGLINDFDTAGIQDVSFVTTKTLGSSTGLQAGTSGFQTVDFGSPSIAVSGTTQTGLDDGARGQQIVSFSGAPFSCGADTALPVGIYNFVISFDGGAANSVFVNVPATPFSFVQLAGAIFGSLGGFGTVSCEASANGLVFTSATTGPASTVSIADGGAFFGIQPLFASILGAGTWTPTINAATPGSNASDYDAQVTIDGSDTQTVVLNGANATTFATLVNELNDDLTGATAAIIDNKLTITSATTGTQSSISITDNDLFSNVKVGAGSPQTTGVPGAVQIGTGVTYQTAISVNGGGQQIVTITGDDAQTYLDLIEVLNLGITGATTQLTTALLGSPGVATTVVRVSSNATGFGSSIDIIDPVSGGVFPGIFSSLDDGGGAPTQETPIDGVDATSYEASIDLGNGARLVNIIGNQAQTFTDLIDEINSQLTSGFIATTTSGDLQITAGNNTVNVIDGPGANLPLFSSLNGYVPPLIPINTGEGSHQAVPPFSDTAWIQIEQVQKDLLVARDRNDFDQFDLSVAGTAPNNIQAGDTVNIYRNGFLFQSDVVVGAGGLTTITGTSPQDFITVIKPKRVLTEEESSFDPDVFDDGTNLIQFREDYNFSETFRLNDLGEREAVYHFWVEDKTTRQGTDISMRQATIELENTPTPFTIFDNLLDEEFSGSPATLIAPRRYTQLILRGLAGVVDDEDRYVLRFTRDFTLRDDLIPRNYTTDLPADFSRVGQEPLDLKTLYTEWTLIREKQPFNIDRALWDKITEAMIARKLTDATVRVPSLERELYDLSFGTQTRFGLRDGQAFVRGDLALATVLDDLQDPNNDFTPVDINVFFANNDFSTEAGIISAMETIYNTFPFEAVNRIFFKVLLDAFTSKAQYPDIFKTSWVSLTGTQVFQTEALFNG